MKTYLERCGFIFDVAINVLTGGEIDETVSLRVAKAQKSGKRWGCMFCRFLDVTVQENHCQRQFEKGNSPAFVYIRAGVAFAFGISAIAGIVKLVYDGAEKPKVTPPPSSRPL